MQHTGKYFTTLYRKESPIGGRGLYIVKMRLCYQNMLSQFKNILLSL